VKAHTKKAKDIESPLPRPMMTQARRGAAWVSCLAIAACRTVSAPPAAAPPAIPAAPVVRERIEHYRIDAARSQVLILVFRDGPMAKLGHNHVLSVHGLSGDVSMLSDVSSASFSLEFPVAAMTIDEPALRAEQGDDFKATVNALSSDGTRGHMLGEQLLDATRFPSIRLKSEQLRAEGDHWLVTLHITVRDRDSTAEVPVALASTQDELTASGEFDLTHAQLGLTPYSVGLGALRVAETIHIRYRLLAQRLSPSGTDAENP
jgi:hypothetical protein